jgi:hypothetical protein
MVFFFFLSLEFKEKKRNKNQVFGFRTINSAYSKIRYQLGEKNKKEILRNS